MTSLERVKKLSDSEIQAWLAKIGIEHAKDLEIALLDSDEETKACVYRNMSSRAASTLMADMAQLASRTIRSADIQAKAAMLESWI